MKYHIITTTTNQNFYIIILITNTNLMDKEEYINVHAQHS